jgi:hypothetical protein
MRRGCADSSRADRFLGLPALDDLGGSGDGAPDDTSGDGAPDDTSGDGAPDDTSGDGAPDSTSGDGAPDKTSGDAASDNTSGDGAPDNATARRFAYGSEHQIHVGACATRDHDGSKSR